MNILSYIHFFALIVTLYISILVLMKNYRSKLNIYIVLIFLSFSIWNFGQIFLHHTSTSEASAKLFLNIGSVGWIFFPVFFFKFTILFSEGNLLLRNRVIYSVLFIFAIVLLFIQLNSMGIIGHCYRVSYGWKAHWNNTIYGDIFYIYYFGSVVFSVFLLFMFWKNTNIFEKKKESGVILLATVIPVTVGTIINLILPLMGINFIPDIANVLIIFLAMGLLFSMEKYEMMKVTPESAAKNIIETMSDSLLILDPKGFIISVNSAATELFGCHSNDIIGVPLVLFIQKIYKHEDDFRKKFLKEPFYNIEVLFLSEQGESFPVLFSSSIMKNKSDVITGVVCVARDISVLKETENKLLTAKQKAEKNEKVKAQFLANMSHEIRTPLNSIMGYTKFMLKEDLTVEFHENLMAISKSGDLLLSIIDDILNLSKIEADKVEIEKISFSFLDICKDVKANGDVLIAEQGKNFPIILTYNDNLNEYILGDPIRITQIINNLIGNAIKFTEKGAIEFIVDKVDDKINIIIKDSGIGISSDKLKVIFKSFKQADLSTTRKYGGVGLGLTITKNLIDLLNGTIEVVSNLNEGTEFTITLPYEEGEEPKNIKIADNLTQEDISYKIMIVEDNLENQKLFSKVLKKFNYDVDIAENGMEAISKFLDDESIDLILMDIQMPILDGVTAVKRIRTIESESDYERLKIPIIALTADVMGTGRDSLIQIGFDDYLSKPVDIDELISKISSFLFKGDDSFSPEGDDPDRRF